MKHLLFNCCSLSVLIFVCVLGETTVIGETAREVINRSIQQYASLQTYRDTGTVETVSIYSDTREVTKLTFETAFSSEPPRFRFEFNRLNHHGTRYNYHDGSRHIIWTEGDNVYTWWDIAPTKEPADSLRLALAAATGISDGSARRIPGLLFRDPPRGAGWEIRDLRNLKRLPDETLDDVQCFRIQGSTLSDSSAREPIVLWIDRSTFLIRRIDEEYSFSSDAISGLDEDFRTVTTTSYKPQMNVDIPEDAFGFASPKD